MRTVASTFDGRLSAGLYTPIFAEFGESATLSRVTGTTAAVTVILNRSGGIVADLSGGAQIIDEDHASILLRESEGNPTKNAAFILGGITWVVVDPPRLSNGVWECTCQRDTVYARGDRRTRQ